MSDADDEGGGGDTVGGPDDNVTSGEDDAGAVEPADTGDAAPDDGLADEPAEPW
ncbi:MULTISPECIES: hypothetical protein [unclassified Solwaraspora]|uniref:hypothetical protein n=1 Tax=unclassified Solwaraspora TaxID=2627926 RepID=UPI00259BD013|nr:hypothetical protein [Solwaraspora sp. WMMA2056]WJK38884.1 hypothetical protein O7608_20570 [Solwaraspora sp. WMMA2056]